MEKEMGEYLDRASVDYKRMSRDYNKELWTYTPPEDLEMHPDFEEFDGYYLSDPYMEESDDSEIEDEDNEYLLNTSDVDYDLDF
jgi:hypothetical protein